MKRSFRVGSGFLVNALSLFYRTSDADVFVVI